MKKASQWIAELKANLTTYQLELAIDKENKNKLHWLAEDDRDVTAVSKITLDAMMQAFVTNLGIQPNLVDNTQAATQKTMVAVAYAYRNDIADRIKNNRKDVPLRPLTKEYVKSKGNNRIAYLEGDLLRAISKSKVVVTKSKKNG